MNNPETSGQDLFLHASSVCVGSRALIFLGHSTSGKSTISQLLSRRYPILADDKVWIKKTENNIWVAGDGGRQLSPKPRDVEKSGQEKIFPISAFIRIFKADEPSLVPISSRMVCGYLLDAVFEVDFQRREENPDNVRSWFKQLSEASKIIPGWHLTFRNDMSIVITIRKVFEESF